MADDRPRTAPGTAPRPADGTRAPRPYRVCFVCTGNICRSPMAEAVFRARLVDAGLDALVTVDSAGTGGWHTGDAADPRTVAVLTAAGYAQRHRARQFTADWFADRDLVIALDRGHQRELRAMAPSPEEAAKVRLLRSYGPEASGGSQAYGRGGAALDVPDPYYGGARGFDDCLELIEAAMPGLLAEVGDAVGEPAGVTGTDGHDGHDGPDGPDGPDGKLG
ncbi:low molecular weight phosphotyrosine protein phosphatase [Streptomyces armeniacus]|uniref:protein-tyrosine-phosphatase n=2 Tax=Streptomyces armeniacus TaxID=83291 RepID=A0A345Y1J4_9ACTN|nr:low molecular weight protein-tyrosine-phosphatase [Streptomyces armeniacus]AXK37760.1 low molecular weight phosphotyrosine protein phosphatase [Streptomyces armeniacus]